MNPNRFFRIAFETPDVTSAGGVAQQPIVGTDPVVNSPIQGQGQEPPATGDFWQFFPNVPLEHRPLLEPHIREMQGHVTRLEQQLAPFKPFVEAGLQAQDAAGLVKFSQDFDAQPIDMWLRMGNMLQTQNILDPEIDLEYLAALANGEDPEEGLQEPQLTGNETPDEIAQLRAQFEELKQEREQEKRTRQEQIQDQLLDRRMTNMKEELKKAGYPEEALSDEALTAQILVHRGNIEAATKSLVDQRAAILKGFTKGTDEDLDLPNGLPESNLVPEPQERDGSWGVARNKAHARLRRENASAAQ
jgi:hypothetical protein